MTLDLAKLRALADGAVKGPWTASHGSWSSSVTSGDIQVAIANLRNSEFIAAARTAIPALLDEVERLRAEDAEWSKLCNQQNALLDEKYRVSDSASCGWCRMALGDPDELPADTKLYSLAEVREHTLTCPNNPLVVQLAALRAARDEACDLGEEANGDPSSCSYNVPIGERLAELRKVGEKP